jgi:hypothetical protein
MAMPITPLLDGLSFDTEAKRVMGVAFEITLVALRLADRTDPLAEAVARQIIDLAKNGERDPDRLCEGALNSLRASPSVTGSGNASATGGSSN